MKNKILMFAGLVLALSHVALAKPPSFKSIVQCEGASISFSFWMPQSNTLYLGISDRDVMRYLLTENSGELTNADYFFSKDYIQEYLTPVENRNDRIIRAIYAAGHITTYTNDPVTNFKDYYGSLGASNPGKQIRVLMDHQERKLKVMLFDELANVERANWVFPNCRDVINY